MRQFLIRSIFAALVLLAAIPVEAVQLRWAAQNDILTLDPHSQNHATTNSILQHTYEGLTRYTKTFGVEPCLATGWKELSPTHWRFNLRQGVKFHDGTPFTADDVVFSFGRILQPQGTMQIYVAGVAEVKKVDDHTVDFLLSGPNPVLLRNLVDFRIMSKAWAEKNRSQNVQDYAKKEETFASRNTNGTGPYLIKSWEPDKQIVFTLNKSWWEKIEGNVTDVIYSPIKSDATRVAALLSGDVDLVTDLPVQDVERLRKDAKLKVLDGEENRTIFIAMDQHSDELKYSNVKGANPLKDLRVRKALYAAIDIVALRRQVMRGYALPTGAMIPTAAQSAPELEGRLLPFDLALAKRLLSEAGYPEGFELGLDCPNNRYVNDERICTAIAGMFAKVGVRVRLNAIPRAQFFQKVDQFDISMHMYGWGGTATDPGFTLTPVLHSPDPRGRGEFNSGRYSDAELDRLIEAAEVELDAGKRRALLLQAFGRVRENVYAIPLHRQVIPWASRANVHVSHRPDNVVEALWIRVD